MSRPAPGNVSNIFFLLVFVGLALGAGFVGSQFTTPALDPWYQGLVKPDFNPPNWVFPVVWTTLFVLMGLAAWLTWRRTGISGAPLAFSVYLGQLVLNVGWSFLFFGQQRPDLAFLEIWVLIAAIALMLVLFARHSGLAALFILPYLAWTSFAAFLNYTIMTLNP